MTIADIVELKAVGLVYVSEADPGIAREGIAPDFFYRDSGGLPVRDWETLKRIRSLAIPPAYTEVWICSLANGHLQATGRDRRGRKQYRYHPRWREIRDESKFERMSAFARALPIIRQRTDEDLALRGLPKAKVIATVIRLLETTLIRVGNARYAAANKSFGLTTLRKRHADVEGSDIKFDFRAKSGKHHKIGLRDRRLARIVRSCQDLPGHHLFQYFDELGERHPIDSDDVNGYLQETTGQAFTAKDFRTWAGTLLAARALSGQPPAESETSAKRLVTDCVKAVAKELGNTAAVCRKCYIHPLVITAYLEGKLAPYFEPGAQKDLEGLTADEASILAFLETI